MGKWESVSACDLVWPRFTASGCPVSRAIVSDSGRLVGEVPVGRPEGFFPGWCCWAVCRALSVSQGEWKLERICKGGLPGLACAHRLLIWAWGTTGAQPAMWLQLRGHQVQAGPFEAVAPGAWGTQRGPQIFLGENKVMPGYVIPPQPLSQAIYNYVVSLNPRLFIDSLLCLHCWCHMRKEEIQMTSRSLSIKTWVQGQLYPFLIYGC